MPWDARQVLAGGRRLAGTWRTDISDTVQMARLRAGICALGGLLGIVALLISIVVSPQTYAQRSAVVPVGIALGLVVIAAVGGLRRERMGDPEFVALLTFGQVFAVAAVAAGQGQGDVTRTALNLMESTLLGALFVERRRLLFVQPLVAVALLGVVATQAPAADSPVVDVCTGGFALLVVGGVVRLLRDQAISALRQARLGELTDPLTGLVNRRGLERAGAVRWRTCIRADLPIALLAIDIDHFKRVNDVQGHAAGDEILRRLAALLLSSVRGEDVAARLGGEEFLVLCAAPDEGTRVVAERIRSRVEQELAPVTVSVGVRVARPRGTDPWPAALWSAVAEADQALYAAKNAGRNRVVAGGVVAGRASSADTQGRFV